MAERSIAWIREIIEVALDQRQDQLNPRESLEISKLLQWEPIKSMEKVLVQFDVGSKPILVKFDPKEQEASGQQQLYLTNEVKEKMHLERLMSGIKDFIALFGKTTTFAE